MKPGHPQQSSETGVIQDKKASFLQSEAQKTELIPISIPDSPPIKEKSYRERLHEDLLSKYF